MAKKGIDIILGELRLDYLDLCLIHWPHGYEEGGDFFPKVFSFYFHHFLNLLKIFQKIEFLKPFVMAVC